MKITNLIIKILLSIIGALLVIVLLWYRFIRQRLPKDIPFDLTEYGCVILIFICCIYSVIILSLIITLPSNNNLSTFIDYIYKPLIVLDNTIKEHSLINHYHEKVLIYIKDLNKRNYIKIYFFLQIFPRIILVTVLSLDTFWFHRIEYFYKIVLIGLLLIIYKYMIYSLKYAKELYTLRIEAMLDQVMTDHNANSPDLDWTFISVRDFIDIQTDSIFYYNHKYKCFPQPHYSYTLKFPPKASHEEIDKESYRLLDIVIGTSLHIENFDLIHNYKKYIKYLKITMLSIYLICWLTILIRSLHMLPPNAFDWLWTIQDNQEPFSLIFISNSDY